jgi:TRAP-type C4-dicarboxylate transport system permease small subunit
MMRGFYTSAAFIRKLAYPISKTLNSLGAWALLGITLLTGLDVFLRYFFARPIKGTYELTEVVLCVLVFFGLAYTAANKGNVSVPLVVSRMPQRARALVTGVGCLLSMALVFVMAWRGFVQAMIYRNQNLTSAIFHFPIFPLLFVVALGCGVLFLILLADFLEAIGKATEK